jgi:hypothetical protein
VEADLSGGAQKIVFDFNATIALYRNTITTGGADRCTCISCKNFAAQRSNAYPIEFLELLKKLGVDPLKEWEAFDYEASDVPSKHLYGGWFLFCGQLVEGGDERLSLAEQNFVHWFTSSFPTRTLPKHARLCAVEFTAELLRTSGLGL